MLPLLLAPALFAAADDPLDRAAAKFSAGKYAEAIELAEKVAKDDPKNPAAPFVAGSARLALRQNAEAAQAFTRAIDLDATAAAAYDRRGDAYLKLGKFQEAVADFDKFLELRPRAAPEHWRRGIALYYAGRFADGVKQFDLHRTVNPEDVENSAWHYLCNARATSPEKARKDLLPVSKDARVPMKEVLELFAGKLKPADVLAAAENAKLDGEEKSAARFYAHLYVGLYYEAEGDAEKAKEHIQTAAEKYKIGHYMWDVAQAHLLTMKK
ncbi:MAG: tetratricopeptide repeat protein [Gemmataceae bacterium]|nr:tetratricopeptide repeat protein [Gemmataceae bacterium]